MEEQQASPYASYPAFAVDYAQSNNLCPFFFLDEVDCAYPGFPDAWKECGELGKLGGCSTVAAGSGAVLRVKAFGDNEELQCQGLPPRDTRLVKWNNTKYKPHRLPGLIQRHTLSEYMTFKRRPLKEREIEQLYSATGGNLRMIEEFVFQGKQLAECDINIPEVQISFAPKEALMDVLHAIRQKQPEKIDVWHPVPVLEAVLLDKIRPMVTIFSEPNGCF